MADRYEFNLDDPESWTKMPKPHLDEGFAARLAEAGGRRPCGCPKFRMVWGCSEEVYVDMSGTHVESGWYLKYQLCNTPPKIVGYEYVTDTGKRVFVKEQNQVPKDKMSIPRFRIQQVGTPRWIMERWREAGEAGIYDAPGYYHFRQICADDEPAHPETFLHPYRDPSENDIQIVRDTLHLEAELTRGQIEAGVAAERQREAEQLEAARAETREGITEGLIQVFRDMPQDLKKAIPRPPKEAIARAKRQLETGRLETL